LGLNTALLLSCSCSWCPFCGTYGTHTFHLSFIWKREILGVRVAMLNEVHAIVRGNPAFNVCSGRPGNLIWFGISSVIPCLPLSWVR
jgi:hypothetical protein